MQNGNFDEKIIELIDQAEEPGGKSAPLASSIPPDERTIYTGVKVEGRWVEFEERQLVEGKIAMMVPKGFKDLDLESAKIKYPSEQRPQTILTDSSSATNILFSYMDEQIDNEEAEAVRDGILNVMVHVNPGIRPQSTGMEVISGKNLAYVEFSNPTIDSKLYNLMYFLELDGKTLMGSFNCLAKSTKYWKRPAFEMMRSLRIMESGKGQTENG